MSPYLPVVILLGVGTVLGLALSALAFLLGPRKPNAEKSDTIECGVPRVTGGNEKMSVKFYMTAILFILFDIETIFLYLWAITFKSLGLFAVAEGFLFIFILFIGYIYVWKRGGLEWI
jgi:NADH-quinone oxidoreductase subunit A